MEGLGGTGEALRIRHSDEVLELAKIHPPIIAQDDFSYPNYSLDTMTVRVDSVSSPFQWAPLTTERHDPA
ncbi:hypothetical protein GCM10009700_21040 [Brevibacterium sanguinis]